MVQTVCGTVTMVLCAALPPWYWTPVLCIVLSLLYCHHGVGYQYCVCYSQLVVPATMVLDTSIVYGTVIVVLPLLTYFWHAVLPLLTHNVASHDMQFGLSQFSLS